MTRAWIGIDNGDGTETGIYCHSGLTGRDMVKKRFKDESSIKSLLALGGVSSIFRPEEMDTVMAYYGGVGNSWQFEPVEMNGCIIIRYINRDGSVQEPAYTIKKDEWPFDMCAFKYIFNPKTGKWHTARCSAAK